MCKPAVTLSDAPGTEDAQEQLFVTLQAFDAVRQELSRVQTEVARLRYAAKWALILIQEKLPERKHTLVDFCTTPWTGAIVYPARLLRAEFDKEEAP